MFAKHYLGIGAVLLFCGVTLAQEKKTTIDDLAWLAGGWDGSSGGREYLEQWIKKRPTDAKYCDLIKLQKIKKFLNPLVVFLSVGPEKLSEFYSEFESINAYIACRIFTIQLRNVLYI